MTTENSSPNDANAAPGAVDHAGANGTGAESQTLEAGTLSAAPEAAHEAALAADAAARRLAQESAQAESVLTAFAAQPEAAHAAAVAADAALHDAAPAEPAPEDAVFDDAAPNESAAAAADAAAQCDDIAAAAAGGAEMVLAGNDSVLPESLGQRLRAAREARGIKIEDAAHAMKLPLSTVQALECDRYERIGEGIYLRSYLSKYLRLLDLPLVLAERVLAQAPEPPPLVTSGTISRPRYLFERYSSSALYLILTAVIIVPAVWLAMRAGFETGTVQITPLDNAEPTPIAAHNPAGTPVPANSAAAGGEHAANDAPLVASLAPFPSIKHEPEAGDGGERSAAQSKPAPAAPAPDGGHTLHLTLPEASWVEIVAADGEKIEYGLLPAGSTRTYRSAKPVDIRLGNATGASFEVDGKTQDLTPFRHSNVAHFRLDRGEIALSHSGG